MEKLKLKIGGILIIIALIAVLLVSLLIPNIKKIGLSAEDKLAMTYHELTNSDFETDSENVLFGAYFARDLDKDGIAEKLAGTAKDMDSSDILYMDINVISDGTLKEGRITISNDSNFKYSMNMIKDDVLANNYIYKNVKVIELNNIRAGTQKLIFGDILPKVASYNDFSKVTQITLTGTYVPSEGDEIEINKTIDLTVDWYSTTHTNIEAYSKEVNINFSNTENEEVNRTIALTFSTEETIGNLVIKDTVATVKIPELYGYKAEEVIENNSGISWDATSSSITITRNSSARKNYYTIYVTYPLEAFEELIANEDKNLNSETNLNSIVNLEFEISAYYEGYNNPNEEFTNPYKSNVASTTALISINTEDIDGERIIEFGDAYLYVSFSNEIYRSRTKDKAISKQGLLDAYDNDEDYYYTVDWFWSYLDNETEYTFENIVLSDYNADQLGN